jgi:ABC-type transport system involved in multi-copper enzyme maturation permease subunit
MCSGFLRIFGPVFYYDLVRQARRGRFVVMRLLYILLLASILMALGGNGKLTTSQAAGVATTYFNAFVLVQLITAVLLTPAYVGTAIAEEKERHTLDFMLATNLSNREIVLSKLGSRLGNVALLVLAGVPMLSIIQLLGGVDPNLVIAFFAVTGMTIVGEAGVSILCSVLCRKSTEAIAASYLALIVCFAVGLILAFVPAKYIPFATTSTGDFIVEVLNAGNLVTLLVEVRAAGAAGTVASVLPSLVRDYMLFHALGAIVCSAVAVARLRRVALAQMDGASTAANPRLQLFKRPRVGMNSLLWKEMYCRAGSRAHWVVVVVSSLLFVASFVTAAAVVRPDWFLSSHATRSIDLQKNIDMWVRNATAAVACLTWFVIAIRASTTITSEREKQQLDALLVTPLGSKSIVLGKCVGHVLSVHLGIVWLLLIWTVGIAMGGLHVVALPLLVTTWILYAAFAAIIGLLSSVFCRSSHRATVLATLIMVFCCAGYWLMWLYDQPPLSSGPRVDHGIVTIAGALSPPSILGTLACAPADVHRFRAGKEWPDLAMACIVLWGLLICATVFLFNVAHWRFCVVNNRDTPPEGCDYSLRPTMTLVPIAPWFPPASAPLTPTSLLPRHNNRRQ